MGLMPLIIFGLILKPESSSAILEWLWWKTPEQFSSSGIPLLQIPFEELTPDDKFLVEASKITGLKLSQLDACQHKLIMKLKASCGSLSDEELAKLSVNLLNCQADVEGRKTYPCTDNMSLKDCTSEMDADIWNTYHIISNRARAVCYAARQEQFRALAEITINKLVSTTRTHLEQMESLNSNQEKLEKATQIALERISHSQHDVLSTYSKLRRLESDFAASLDGDKSALEQLGALIENERNSIAVILSDFKKAIDESGKELKKQKQIKSAEHEKVIGDLSQTNLLIAEMMKQLTDMNEKYDQQFKKSKSQFSESQEKLTIIHKSLNDIYSRLNTLEKIADNKTSLILSYIGQGGENFDLTLLCSIHLICLAASMIICSFLELPLHFRALILSSAILNTCLSIFQAEYSVSILLFYLSSSLVAIVDLAAIQIYRFCKKSNRGREVYRPSRNAAFYNSRAQNGLKEPLSRVDEWLTEKYHEHDNFAIRNGTLLMTPTSDKDEDETSLKSGVSTRSKRNLTSARSDGGSSSGRKTACSVTRPNGLKCKLPATPGNSTCRFHEKQR